MVDLPLSRQDRPGNSPARCCPPPCGTLQEQTPEPSLSLWNVPSGKPGTSGRTVDGDNVTQAVEGKLRLKLSPAFPLVAAAGPGISCLALRGAVSPAGLWPSRPAHGSVVPPLGAFSLRAPALVRAEDSFPCPQELEA